MAVFGIDVSHYQTGLNIKTTDATTFVIAKVTDGQSMQDTEFQPFRRQAETAGLLFAAYHFLRSTSPVEAQATNTAAALGDKSIPVIIDIERSETSRPTMAHVNGYALALRNRGFKVSPLLYLPRWYWMEIGRPDVSTWDIWNSGYGSNNGVYPGDDSANWDVTGTFAPKMLQYTSRGRIPGYDANIDRNAFRQDRPALVSSGWFKDYTKDELEMAGMKELQDWVATTPILVNVETSETQPLQRVLRTILNRLDKVEAAASLDEYTGPTAAKIAEAVISTLPPSVTLDKTVIEDAVANVLTKGTSTYGSAPK